MDELIDEFESFIEKEKAITSVEVQDSSLLASNNHSMAFGFKIFNNENLNSAISSLGNMKIIKLNQIQQQFLKNSDEKWAVVGIVARKNPPKISSKGKEYMVLGLTSLMMNEENRLTNLYLFGSAYKKHSSMDEHSVICVLSPSNFNQQTSNTGASSASSASSAGTGGHQSKNFCISIFKEQDLIVIGQSTDCSSCKATSNQTNLPCSNIINSSYGDYCEYHVQKQYRTSHSKRMDLQFGFGKPLVSMNSGKRIGSSEIHNNPQMNDSMPNNETKISDIPRKSSLNPVSIGFGQKYLEISTKLQQTKNTSSSPTQNTSKNQSKTSKTPSKTSKTPCKTHVDGEKPKNQLVQSPFNAKQFMQANQPPPKLGSSFLSNNHVILFDRPKSQDSSTSALDEPKRSRLELLMGPLDEKQTKSIIDSKPINFKHALKEEDKNIFKRLDALEKIDGMQLKMESITELKVKAIVCKQCDYMAEYQSDLCKNKNHRVITVESTKRYFKCSNCHTKLNLIGSNLPNKPCSKCHFNSWIKTSMTDSNRKSNVPSDDLKIRIEDLPKYIDN